MSDRKGIMLTGIQNIVVISALLDEEHFRELLGDGGVSNFQSCGKLRSRPNA